MPALTEKRYHLLFDIGMWIKAVLTVIELIGGVLLYVMSAASLNGLLAFFIGGEMNEQPRDLLWGLFIQGYQSFLGPAQSFWAFILVSHSIAKIAALIAIYYGKLWAYPAAAAVFGALAFYQIYSYVYFHSLLIILLTVFDVILIGLILHEWLAKRKSAPLQ